jgi:phosphomethylpyrimidine synthase
MKITQEVPEFAAKQNAGVDAFIAADPSSEALAKEEEVEAGMAEMSERFREEGWAHLHRHRMMLEG